MFTACGIMHRRCCQQAASSVHYTTSCKHSLVLLRMRNYRPKHVELIEIINKTIIVAFSWLFILLDQYRFTPRHTQHLNTVPSIIYFPTRCFHRSTPPSAGRKHKYMIGTVCFTTSNLKGRFFHSILFRLCNCVCYLKMVVRVDRNVLWENKYLKVQW